MNNIIKIVHQLQDHELALLLSLAANEHCILSADTVDDLDELQGILLKSLVNVFGVSKHVSIVRCDEATTENEFMASLLVKKPKSYIKDASTGRARPGSPAHDEDPREFYLPNIIICRDLNFAREEVQYRLLELLQTGKLRHQNRVHNAPKEFLFVSLLLNDLERPALNTHLLDTFFISHYFRLDDLHSDESEPEDDDASSTTSVIIKKPKDTTKEPLVSSELLLQIHIAAERVYISADVKRYMADIAVFLRMHRAVRSGISAAASRNFDQLVRCLAPLHGQDFVTPALVSLAAYKIYNHRIIITTPDEERSMMWGSDREVVKQMLENFTPELIIESVLKEVRPPL